jgi:hypothetical protein
VEAKQLHQLQFRDDAELAVALHYGPTQTLSWTLRKG